MSYASLAGLPLSFGLYGALVPCLVFMLFATSRQLVSKQVFVQHAAALRSATPYITGPSSLPSCPLWIAFCFERLSVIDALWKCTRGLAGVH